MKAVIFDMDGVLIDSEDLWKQAEFEVFSSLGVNVSDEECILTASMTTSEVTNFWFDKFSWSTKSLVEVEEMVIDRSLNLYS
ncbi:beta-phosphoglucomutase-like phosphatase (HAD superfamily) [Chryseobacterium sp. H1D6B]|uniref:HAD hydrolase-like protein n=1 Tax=Chryseobacterium sp. H1D6B TaxID=2940588 RepID=UPI0017AADECF|nr:HAD hydrolase-like protein [Chryseobacterium sp. H1D6B]MDH6252438.1 beta-phosphoglucomutase-like phosphatase (HAD superfamily) [Chryseobacterium sp. H1D6B]